MKKHLYFAEAERLYVTDQMTVEEITRHIPVSEKTVRLWKAEGQWDEKRVKFIQERTTVHEELYKLARNLMVSINQDIESGKEVSQSRMYTFVRLLPLLLKIKQYEDIILAEKNKSEKDGKKGLSPEALDKIEQLIFGL